MRVCMCDSERVVLGAGVETLCGEHVLMSTAAQQEMPSVRPSVSSLTHKRTGHLFHASTVKCTPLGAHCETLLWVFNAPLK